MRLPFFRSKPAATAATRADRGRPGPAPDESALVDAARTRARRRLLGALVLLAVGVVGFPIVFETQPRPLPVDTPILLPPTQTARRDAPPARPQPQPPAESSAEVAAPEAAASALPRARPAEPPVAAVEEPAAPPAAAAASAGTGEASAVAAAPPASNAGAGRFVVQVGAYTDPATLRETRARVEKLGLKTYTQVVSNEAGPRTRVRLGPFPTRDEADAAAARLKRAGLPANILAL